MRGYRNRGSAHRLLTLTKDELCWLFRHGQRELERAANSWMLAAIKKRSVRLISRAWETASNRQTWARIGNGLYWLIYQGFEIVSNIQALTLTRKALRGLILLSSIPLFGMVAAFGIAPDTAVEDVPVEQVVLGLEIPEIRAGSAEGMTFWRHE